MLRFFSLDRVTFLIIFAVLGTATVIHDPDYYLHLVAGRYILTHESLPNVDVFSFTVPGAPWHMHEWLFEVLVAKLNSIGGEHLIIWVIAAMGVFSTYIVYRAGLSVKQRSIFWLLPALVMLAFYLPFVTQRPQVITYVSYALFLFAMLAFKYRGQLRWLWLLPPVMIVWVNSHGAFILGIAVLGLFTITEYWLWLRSDREATRLGALKILAMVFITTLLASLINPYFIGQWRFPFELMNRQALSVISEWQRLDLSEPLFQGYLFCVLLFFGNYLTQKKTPDITEWLLPLGAIVASFIAGRHVPIAVLTMLPFLMRTMGRPSRLSGWLGHHRMAIGAGDMGDRENVLNMGLLLMTILLLWFLAPLLQLRQHQLKEAILPVKAVNFIEEHNIHGRLFNQYRYGGYLLYKFFPVQRVFIDIRADMYGDEMMRKYTKIYFGARGWESTFDSYDINTVLCESDAPIVGLLQRREDFTIAYRDEHNVVLVRNTP